MAEGTLQVPPDSTGQKLRVESLTVGSNTVLQQIVTLGDSSGTLVDATANGLKVDATATTQPTSTADGSSVALGAKADSAYTDTTGAASGSVTALLKGLFKLIAGTLTVKRALGTTTASSVSVTTTSAQIVAANTARKSLRIVNPTTSTKTVYLEFGATAATTSSATALTPGDTYYETEASDRVNAIVSSGTQSVNIFEVA